MPMPSDVETFTGFNINLVFKNIYGAICDLYAARANCFARNVNDFGLHDLTVKYFNEYDGSAALNYKLCFCVLGQSILN